MSDHAASARTSVPKILRQRRAERLRREIALLEHMDNRLWRKGMVCAAGAILGMMLLLVLVLAKAHVLSDAPVVVYLACLAIAAAVWFIGRYVLLAPIILVSLALLFLLEDFINPLELLPNRDRKKRERREKVAAALKKRQILLAKLEAKS